MRWTRELRLTCAARAYGEVVWFGRRGAGVKRAIRSAGDGGKRAVLREEHEVSRKAIAQGRPECSSCPVCSCAVLFAQIARETAGAASTRSSLRPLFSRGQTKMQTSGDQRRENAKLYPAVIASAVVIRWFTRLREIQPVAVWFTGPAASVAPAAPPIGRVPSSLAPRHPSAPSPRPRRRDRRWHPRR